MSMIFVALVDTEEINILKYGYYPAILNLWMEKI